MTMPAPAVLVVNDHEAQRLAVRVMLEPLGLEIVEADSGREALRCVLRHTFAVILMDVRMPGMDGYETTRLIRQRSASELTPVIFFTAFGRDDTETLTAYASGAVDFIFTPVLADVLRAKVTVFVDLFRQSEELKRSLESITGLNDALRDSQVRAQAVLENVADGIVTADEDGRIESFNAAAEALFGYREGEVVGEPLELIIAPTADDATESVGHRKDGTSFPLEVGVSRMRIGDRTFTIGCVRDITERRQRAERERVAAAHLLREAQRDRVAFDEAPIGSVITDREGVIERVNQSVCTMTGYSATELLGTRYADLAHDEDRGHTSAVLAELTAGSSETERYEKQLLHKSGRAIECRVALTSIRDEGGEVAQLFAQIEDVTESRVTRRELEQAQLEMLARLASAAEFHDDITGRHTRRVGELSVAIGERMGLPEHQLELLRVAAPLHDVGKIAIPDAVLGKPGSLTPEEFERVKTHTTIGAQMLAGSAFELLELAEQIALTHHEKWDGTGYPAGLAGEDIPITGRIVAVADVFDALTHERPYKPAWSIDDALAEMTSEAGSHFDPKVLDAFLDLKMVEGAKAQRS